MAYVLCKIEMLVRIDGRDAEPGRRRLFKRLGPSDTRIARAVGEVESAVVEVRKVSAAEASRIARWRSARRRS